MDPTAAFTALVTGPADALHLDEAALLISAHATPNLDVEGQLERLDRLSTRCPDSTIDGLRWLLFDEMGLRGDTGTYQDPRNSYLDQVLDRARGIPISLSVLMMEVGRRVGVELEGVGMPGHFLVGAEAVLGHPPELLDPFGGGRRLDAEECRLLHRSLHGSAAPWSSDLLAPTPPHAILARMLANLAASYAANGDTAARTWVARLRAAVPGQPAGVQARLSEERRSWDASTPPPAFWRSWPPTTPSTSRHGIG